MYCLMVGRNSGVSNVIYPSIWDTLATLIVARFLRLTRVEIGAGFHDGH